MSNRGLLLDADELFLADLRAKVEALRHEDECDVSRGRERPETGMAECNCLRADVLALFKEEANE